MPDTAHWTERRKGLFRRIEMMRSGVMKTLEGPTLEIDTTEFSLRDAEQSLAAIDRLLVRRGVENA